MRKYFIRILIVLWIGILILSCRKKEEFNPVDVALISPEENSLLKLPDTLMVKFTITTDRKVDLASVTIVNKNYTPLFGTKYIDDPPTDELISKLMVISALQHTEDIPYYILISVRCGEETEHNYFNIRLTNRPLSYKGFYAFVKSSVHETSIDFYDQEMEKNSFAATGGDYVDSDISGFYGKLFLATGTPEKLITFDLFDQQPVWEAEPLMPYPVFTDLCAKDSRIYAATGNGQISGYAGLNGQLQFVAERQQDSVPGKVIVLDEYLIGYYRSRLNARKSLVSFYMATGVKKHQYPVDFEVVSFFEHEEPDKSYVFGNSDGEGIVAVFIPHENHLGEEYKFGFGSVDAVCRTDDEEFVILSGRRLYAYDESMHQERLLKTVEDSAFCVKYEEVWSRLYVLFQNKLLVYSYPAMNEIHGTDFDLPLKGIEFYYRYE